MSEVEIANMEEENKPKILVVDDEITILRLLKINLTKNGYQVITASNGREALQVIEDEPDIDLVLLDIMMPEMNGYQVCSIVRQKYSLYELPIMFVTAKFQVHDIIEGFDIGANDYILKPYDFKELLARAKTLVKLKSLTKSNEILKQVKDLTTRFHTMTIHDLKNPLTSIFVRSEFIEMQLKEDSQLVEHIQSIRKMANVMLALIKDFEEMSKIETGKVSMTKSKICLNKLSMKKIDDNSSNAERKSQELRFKPGPADNVFVHTDGSLLERVLDNLISNAIKYSPENSPIDIIIEKTKNDNNVPSVRWSVKDYGPGLTPEDLKNVFNKFQKLSARPTGGESSSGLGLSIAKELIELMGGNIWVESNINEGSTFIFDIPETSV